MLDDITVAITYESNLEKTEKITIESVKKIMLPYKLDHLKKFKSRTS